MNVIRLITTEGCEACNIAKKLITDAIKQSGASVKLQIIDCLDEKYKDFIRIHNIYDYPTIIFMQDDITIFTRKGTMAVPQLLYQIKLWFN